MPYLWMRTGEVFPASTAGADVSLRRQNVEKLFPPGFRTRAVSWTKFFASSGSMCVYTEPAKARSKEASGYGKTRRAALALPSGLYFMLDVSVVWKWKLGNRGVITL